MNVYADIMILCRHQLRALAMMIEKEARVSTGSKFPSLWDAVTTRDGLVKYVEALQFHILIISLTSYPTFQIPTRRDETMGDSPTSLLKRRHTGRCT